MSDDSWCPSPGLLLAANSRHDLLSGFCPHRPGAITGRPTQMLKHLKGRADGDQAHLGVVLVVGPGEGNHAGADQGQGKY